MQRFLTIVHALFQTLGDLTLVTLPALSLTAICLIFDCPGWTQFFRRKTFPASSFLLEVPKSWLGRACAACLLAPCLILLAPGTGPWLDAAMGLTSATPPIPAGYVLCEALAAMAFFFFLAFKRRTATLRFGKLAIEFHRMTKCTSELHIQRFSNLMHCFAQNWQQPVDMHTLSPQLRNSPLAACSAIALDKYTLTSLREGGVCALEIVSPLISFDQVVVQLAYCKGFVHGYRVWPCERKLDAVESTVLIMARVFTRNEWLVRNSKIIKGWKLVNQCIPLNQAWRPLCHGFRIILSNDNQ